MKGKTAFFAALIAAFISVGASNAVAATYLQDAPPPPIKETYAPKAGHVWAPGYYNWDKASKSYKWNSGRMIKARKGYIWAPNRWVKTPKGWKYEKGKWISKSKMDKLRAQAEAKKQAQKCGVKKGYKIGYRKSVWSDEYNFKKK